MYSYYYVDIKLVDAALYNCLLANTTGTIIDRNTIASFRSCSNIFFIAQKLLRVRTIVSSHYVGQKVYYLNV